MKWFTSKSSDVKALWKIRSSDGNRASAAEVHRVAALLLGAHVPMGDEDKLNWGRVRSEQLIIKISSSI